LLGELRDHILDLQEAEMNHGKEAAEAINYSERIGDPQQLAERVVAAQVYSNWSGRHPWLAFVLGAPILFLVSVVGIAAMVVGFTTLVEGQTLETNPGLANACRFAGWTIAFVPAIVASLILCRFVRRSRRRRLWGLAACGFVALLAGCLMVNCSPPLSQPGTGNLTIGFGVGAAWRASQALMPLLIGTLFLILPRRETDPFSGDLEPQPARTAA